VAADLHDAIEERLRGDAQRYTSGRRRLVDVLRGAAAPLTLPQILTADHALVQSSAYRNLAVLEQVGVVTKITGAGDFASFELAEDLTGHHHHHLVCSSCGEVSDFALTPAVEEQLDRALARAAKAAHYDVESHRLDVVGRCASCR
jgi:Fur family ferric uptake transcriptional regulator